MSVSCLLAFSSGTAQALDIPFTLPGPGLGTAITGILRGLQDNATSFPTEITLTSFPANAFSGGWGAFAANVPIDVLDGREWDRWGQNGNGFTLVDGQ